jgi:hypothetical protein
MQNAFVSLKLNRTSCVDIEAADTPTWLYFVRAFAIMNILLGFCAVWGSFNLLQQTGSVFMTAM